MAIGKNCIKASRLSTLLSRILFLGRIGSISYVLPIRQNIDILDRDIRVTTAEILCVRMGLNGLIFKNTKKNNRNAVWMSFWENHLFAQNWHKFWIWKRLRYIMDKVCQWHIFIGLHCVNRSLWSATTLATLVGVF